MNHLTQFWHIDTSDLEDLNIEEWETIIAT